MNASLNTKSALTRAYMFLEDKGWKRAKEYFESVLDIEPQNAEAYFGLLMASLKTSNINKLLNYNTNKILTGNRFYNIEYFKKAVRFADNDYREKLKSFETENRYRHAVRAMSIATSRSPEYFYNVIPLFKHLGDYKDSKLLLQECIYKYALTFSVSISTGNLEKAAKLFEQIADYKNSSELREQCLKKIPKIKKTRKRILIISTIVLTISGILFGWWASITIPQNNLRAEKIKEKFFYEKFYRSGYEIICDTGIYKVDRFIKEEFSFNTKNAIKSYRTDTFTHKCSLYYEDKWETTKHEVDTDEDIYEYKINISLNGRVILKFDYNTYIVKVDESDNPLSFSEYIGGKIGETYTIR